TEAIRREGYRIDRTIVATVRQQFLSGNGIPYLGGLIPTGGRNPPTVGGKDRTVDALINGSHSHVAVPGERKHFAAVGCVPYLGRIVPTAGEEQAAVRRKGYRPDPSLMSIEREHCSPAGRIP